MTSTPSGHLPAHLDRVGRHDDLRTLLTSRSPGSLLGSTWADAHDRAGTLDDYLALTDLARGAAERKTDMLIAADRLAPGLARRAPVCVDRRQTGWPLNCDPGHFA